ncbi:hypothetical protein FACS1894125_1040 [Actinomycetota bacterium]|nr:hypothetical protein FACS1894125_1040 [Actinomycetota bacterium]
MSNNLTPDEMRKYIVVKQYVNEEIDRQQAATMLSVTSKTITRLKKAYLTSGKDGFSHKSKGNTPINKFSPED